MRMVLQHRACWERQTPLRVPSATGPRHLAKQLGRRLLLHVLPFLLMLLVIGGLSLKAGNSIERAKQSPSYAALSEH